MYYIQELKKVSVLYKKSMNPLVSPLSQTLQQVQQKAFEVQQKFTPSMIQYLDQYVVKQQYLYQIVERVHYMPLPKDDNFQELAGFLNTTYKNNYYIWNIGEYKIPSDLFNNQVNECNIVGFPCPTLKLIFAICKQILTWINGDPLNHAIVNCQASLGRSVLLISCLLCLMKQFSHPGEAVSHISQILKVQEKQILFATHQLYLQYFVNVKNGIKLNLNYVIIKKVVINGIPINQNKDQGQQFMPYFQIFDENNILFNSLKQLKEEGNQKFNLYLHNQINIYHLIIIFRINQYNQNDSGFTFNVNLELEPEQDILIRCKHLHSRTIRYPVFRILLNTGFLYDEVVRFYKKDVEFSPFYEPNDDFFIDFIIEFKENKKQQSELQQTFKIIEAQQFKENDTNFNQIINKGINQNSQNNLDFSLESHEEQKLEQEINQSLKLDEENKEETIKDDEKIEMNQEQKQIYQQIVRKITNEEEDLDDYFNQLENE